MAVRVVPLGSSSRGNATLVEIGSTRVLVDAGLSARALVRRLEGVGLAPRDLECILLSHEHGDHTRGVERFSRLYGVPVASVPETLDAMDLSHQHLAAWVPIETGRIFEVGAVRVRPFPVPHDAVRPVGFVLEGEGARVGIVTDLGHATTLVVERLRGCQILMVEANHDAGMLTQGPYPWHLKQRVGSRLGHLSNGEAADLVARAADRDCRAVVLAHLSEKNNTPALARTAVAQALARSGVRRVEMRVAPARGPGVPVTL